MLCDDIFADPDGLHYRYGHKPPLRRITYARIVTGKNLFSSVCNKKRGRATRGKYFRPEPSGGQTAY
ncbi:hypothetical protein FKW15_11380 [Acetobacter sp. DmW_125133]|nr:hypothetical protein CBI36_02325 [Acetobacter oryzifermentans]ATI11926.1 hypothetical protein CPF11_05285 [Acetobacter pomorum]AXC27644.1 hypothetical protein DS739_02140 [Acetobacter sp. JWB]KAA8384282.1 hypothetical protein FKW31_12040 [Acetobacter sp. DmW_136]KAA8395027.1 hypothetical protein FKW19_11870 [Acetobacter sp. DmW_125128]KAA8398761.1 hypothetical protein FKW20_07370 [Acetobacter sp. DmW_125127]KAA8399719.1 hypothetical protein FKW22_02110 [Acetobacter sp. DmW_125124]KAA84030